MANNDARAAQKVSYDKFVTLLGTTIEDTREWPLQSIEQELTKVKWEGKDYGQVVAYHKFLNPSVLPPGPQGTSLPPSSVDTQSTAVNSDVQALALPIDFFNTQRMGIHFEGLLMTPWAMQRDTLCDTIISMVKSDPTKRILVRGPYCSGKTSIAQLLTHHLHHNKQTAYIVTLLYPGNWETCWFTQTKVLWSTIMASPLPVFVIIDEVQHSYAQDSPAHDLWKFLKLSTQIATRSNVHYICIGAYGDPSKIDSLTPDDFAKSYISLRPHNGSPGLAYTYEEFLALCKVFEETVRIKLDDRSRNYIYYLSSGHPGIIGLVFSDVYEHYKNCSEEVKAAGGDVYRFLHSGDLHISVRNARTRAIPNFTEFETTTFADKAKISEVCRQVLCAPGFAANYHTDFGKDHSTVEFCLKASILVRNSDLVTFSCPIIESRALGHFFSETTQDPKDLNTFIIGVVQRFSSIQLCRTESKDTQSRIMEAQWQQEFYRAAACSLPDDAIVSPEYGREKGADGQVDFYISKYKWMIEILREGLDMAKHERRFEPGGQYESLINGGDWCVVDFRATSKQVRRKPHAHTYHVSFSADKKLFKIWDPQGRKQVFTVMGDEVAAVSKDRIPGGTPSRP